MLRSVFRLVSCCLASSSSCLALARSLASFSCSATGASGAFAAGAGAIALELGAGAGCPITLRSPGEVGILSLVHTVVALGACFCCSLALRAASATDWLDCSRRRGNGRNATCESQDGQRRGDSISPRAFPRASHCVIHGFRLETACLHAIRAGARWPVQLAARALNGNWPCVAPRCPADISRQHG